MINFLKGLSSLFQVTLSRVLCQIHNGTIQLLSYLKIKMGRIQWLLFLGNGTIVWVPTNDQVMVT